MWVEINRIAGDIYVNGAKVVFAVDFKLAEATEFENVDWLIGWAKIGLISRGHTVPHFEIKELPSNEKLAALVPIIELPKKSEGVLNREIENTG